MQDIIMEHRAAHIKYAQCHSAGADCDPGLIISKRSVHDAQGLTDTRRCYLGNVFIASYFLLVPRCGRADLHLRDSRSFSKRLDELEVSDAPAIGFEHLDDQACKAIDCDAGRERKMYSQEARGKHCQTPSRMGICLRPPMCMKI